MNSERPSVKPVHGEAQPVLRDSMRILSTTSGISVPEATQSKEAGVPGRRWAGLRIPSIPHQRSTHVPSATSGLVVPETTQSSAVPEIRQSKQVEIAGGRRTYTYYVWYCVCRSFTHKFSS